MTRITLTDGPVVALFLDENLASASVARQLRAAGHTVYLPQELGLRRAHDPIILAEAASRSAVVVTNNVHDFVELHRKYERTGEAHPGIMLALRTDPSRLIQSLERAARLLTPRIAASQQMYLDSFKSEDEARNYVIALTPQG
jgi:predicted nuclease of predicted toxin-antitoxin system